MNLSSTLGYRVCSSCGKTKSVDEFPQRIDRRRCPPLLVRIAKCTSCERRRNREWARRRTREQRQAERRRIAVRLGRKYRTTDELRARRTERESHRQARRSPSRLRSLVSRLLSEDPSAIALSWSGQVYRAKYRYDADFRAKEIARRRRRKSAGLAFWLEDGTLTGSVIQGLFAKAHHCPYCNKPMRPREKTLDHIIPRAKAGLHSIRNVVVCCRTCNSRKGKSTSRRWLLRAGVRFSDRGSHSGAARVADRSSDDQIR